MVSTELHLSQITLPEETSRKLYLREGEQLLVKAKDGQVVLTPRRIDFLTLAGCLTLRSKRTSPVSEAEIEKAVEEGWTRRWR